MHALMTHPYNPTCKMEGHIAAGIHSKPYLTRDDIRDIEPLLREIGSPFILGVHLNIPIDVLSNIEGQHHDVKRQMIEVIDYWLKICTKCTWGALAEAVKRVGGHDNLAHKLNQKDSVCAESVEVESMELESIDPIGPMMVSVPIRGDSSRTRQPEKRIGTTKSCPNFLVVSGGETSSVSDCRKLRSSSVSDTRGRVTLNDSDFADSSPSSTEMEIDTNESTSTPPKYKAVNAPTPRAKQLQMKHNMLQIIEELISNPDAKEFINFVDKKRVDYYKKIYYPMCLDEIKGRINRGHCCTREKFCEEFCAIVENCEMYYGSESEQAVKVRKLKAQFDERVKQHIPDDRERKLSLPQELELPSESSDSDGEESDVRSMAKKKKTVKEVVPSELQLDHEYIAVDAPTPRGKRLQIKHNMLKILEELKGRSDAAEFINFVNERRAEDYYSVIDYPMCLNEIRDRINRYQCDSRAKFYDEFIAIIENCEKYNGPDSDYTLQARTLKARFDELVKQHVPDDCDLPLEYECASPNSSSKIVEELPTKARSSKDKVTVEELMELRHARGRIHWKLPIIKHASFKWKDIAKLIGCHTQRMKVLEEQCKDPDDCLKQALIENFIQNKPKHYCRDWSGLAELLNDVGLKCLAENILAYTVS